MDPLGWILACVGCLGVGAGLGGWAVGQVWIRSDRRWRSIDTAGQALQALRELQWLERGEVDGVRQLMELRLDREFVELARLVKEAPGVLEEEPVRKTLDRILEFRDVHPSPTAESEFGPFVAEALEVGRRMLVGSSAANGTTRTSPE